MLCKSCNGEVPPKFSHAISVNVCPFCGDPIMAEELQIALVDLKSIMTICNSYPDEVFDWLKSNYNLILKSEMDQKLKEVEDSVQDRIKNEVSNMKSNYFKRPRSSSDDQDRPIIDKNGNQIEGDMIQSPDLTNKIMKRAGVSDVIDTKDQGIVDRSSHFKKIVDDIRKKTHPSVSENGNSGVLTPEMLQALDEDEMGEMQSYFNSPGLASGVDNEYDDEDEIPSVVSNWANQSKRSQSGDYNAKDLAALQKMHDKARRTSKAINNGGSVGLIKR